MPWPPQPADLTDDKIPLPESLSTFMNVLLSGKHTPCQIARGIRSKLSIGMLNYFLRLKCRKDHCFCIIYS